MVVVEQGAQGAHGFLRFCGGRGRDGALGALRGMDCGGIGGGHGTSEKWAEGRGGRDNGGGAGKVPGLLGDCSVPSGTSVSSREVPWGVADLRAFMTGKGGNGGVLRAGRDPAPAAARSGTRRIGQACFFRALRSLSSSRSRLRRASTSSMPWVVTVPRRAPQSMLYS